MIRNSNLNKMKLCVLLKRLNEPTHWICILLYRYIGKRLNKNKSGENRRT